MEIICFLGLNETQSFTSFDTMFAKMPTIYVNFEAEMKKCFIWTTIFTLVSLSIRISYSLQQ